MSSKTTTDDGYVRIDFRGEYGSVNHRARLIWKELFRLMQSDLREEIHSVDMGNLLCDYDYLKDYLVKLDKFRKPVELYWSFFSTGTTTLKPYKNWMNGIVEYDFAYRITLKKQSGGFSECVIEQVREL